MMSFITKNKQKTQLLFAALFWLFIWQIASMLVGYSFLLSSPLQVLKALFRLTGERAFWHNISGSIMRICLGFGLSVLCGVIFAILSYKISLIKILLSPFMLTIKSMPVASFTVLALLWLTNSSNLAVLISFAMTLPVIYVNTLTGIQQRDKSLAQMAKVFRISALRRLIYIDLPQIIPYFYSAFLVSVGLAWKSGIAAEVIGITKNSIGGAIYDAKLILSTEDVLAYTIIIILLSFIIEKLISLLLNFAIRCISKGEHII